MGGGYLPKKWTGGETLDKNSLNDEFTKIDTVIDDFDDASFEDGKISPAKLSGPNFQCPLVFEVGDPAAAAATLAVSSNTTVLVCVPIDCKIDNVYMVAGSVTGNTCILSLRYYGSDPASTYSRSAANVVFTTVVLENEHTSLDWDIKAGDYIGVYVITDGATTLDDYISISCEIKERLVA